MYSSQFDLNLIKKLLVRGLPEEESSVKIVNKYIKSEKMLQFENDLVSYPYNPIYCSICDKTFAARSTLKLHVEITHEANSSTIDDCKETQNFGQVNLIKEIEMVKCEENLNEDEPIIENISDSQDNNDINTVKSSLTTLKCNQCKDFISKVEDLQKHFNSNTSGSCMWPFKCIKCDEIFGKKNRLMNHLKADHLGNRYKCNECRKSFTTQSRLRKHVCNRKTNSLPKLSLQSNISKLVTTNQNRTFQVF